MICETLLLRVLLMPVSMWYGFCLRLIYKKTCKVAVKSHNFSQVLKVVRQTAALPPHPTFVSTSAFALIWV